jgi:hypothetical protein
LAINYTISYTFAPSTTISSSQVNTNFSDNSNTWNGLEALTKTFAKLKVDVDPATALEVVTKQYVDHYSTYRRPVLQYNSATVVNMETGINGVSGQLAIQFPDGTLRTDSTAGRIQCNLAQVAALTVTAQSGLRTGTVANNTWYAVYAVKSQVNSTDIVAVADVVLPTQANYATLNTNFGTSGWVYIGLIRNGDQGGTATGILNFIMGGNQTIFVNAGTGANADNSRGVLLATTAGAANLQYAVVNGTAGAVIPNNVVFGTIAGTATATTSLRINEAGGAPDIYQVNGLVAGTHLVSVPYRLTATYTPRVTPSGATAIDIWLVGFVDGVLGVGSNPIL